MVKRIELSISIRCGGSRQDAIININDHAGLCAAIKALHDALRLYKPTRELLPKPTQSAREAEIYTRLSEALDVALIEGHAQFARASIVD